MSVFEVLTLLIAVANLAIAFFNSHKDDERK